MIIEGVLSCVKVVFRDVGWEIPRDSPCFGGRLPQATHRRERFSCDAAEGLESDGGVDAAEDRFDPLHYPILDDVLATVATLANGQARDDDNTVVAHLERQRGMPCLKRSSTYIASHGLLLA